MTSRKFEAVIFDLDGTLIDSMWVWRQIDKEFLGKRNIVVPENLDKEIEGKSFTETAEYFKERFKFSMSIDEIKAEWSQMAWDFYTNRVELKKGAKQFLEVLAGQNIKIGIATSNSRELVEAVLNAHDIMKYFTSIKTSCEVGRGKPFPDIYLKVAEDLEVQPQDCLVFEDIPNGIRAGKNAKMTTCGIRDRQPEEVWEEVKQLADYNIEDYNHIIKEV